MALYYTLQFSPNISPIRIPIGHLPNIYEYCREVGVWCRTSYSSMGLRLGQNASLNLKNNITAPLLSSLHSALAKLDVQFKAMQAACQQMGTLNRRLNMNRFSYKQVPNTSTRREKPS